MSVYFWRNDRVETINRRLTVLNFDQSSMFKYLYCPCVDTYAWDLSERYGMFVNEASGWIAKARWESQSIESFPPEFRAHLLLLGVS
jgi:hypothetical protein